MSRRLHSLSRIISRPFKKSTHFFQSPFRSTQTTTKWKSKLATLHTKMDVTETESLYDDWASSYDECLDEWGYKVPSIAADLFKTHYSENNNKQKETKVFDLGCGTGLVGKELVETNSDFDFLIFGSDLSAAQFPMAESKGYHHLQQWDLNEFPFPFDDNGFDALTCCGTLTYAVDKVKLFCEWSRITKDEAIIICSHRSDQMKEDLVCFEQMEKEGKWIRLHLSDPVPYLPNNENY